MNILNPFPLVFNSSLEGEEFLGDIISQSLDLDKKGIVEHIKFYRDAKIEVIKILRELGYVSRGFMPARGVDERYLSNGCQLAKQWLTLAMYWLRRGTQHALVGDRLIQIEQIYMPGDLSNWMSGHTDTLLRVRGSFGQGQYRVSYRLDEGYGFTQVGNLFIHFCSKKVVHRIATKGLGSGLDIVYCYNVDFARMSRCFGALPIKVVENLDEFCAVLFTVKESDWSKLTFLCEEVRICDLPLQLQEWTILSIQEAFDLMNDGVIPKCKS